MWCRLADKKTQYGLVNKYADARCTICPLALLRAAHRGTPALHDATHTSGGEMKTTDETYLSILALPFAAHVSKGNPQILGRNDQGARGMAELRKITVDHVW